jgi:hypothetical protein
MKRQAIVEAPLCEIDKVCDRGWRGSLVKLGGYDA